MSQKNRFARAATGVALLAALAAFAVGCGHHPHDPAKVAAMVNARVDAALDDLSATAAQRTEVHAIADKLLESAKALHEGNQPLHAELLAEWQSPTPDSARLHALVDQRMDALRAFAHQAVDNAVELHDLLTPDQRAQVTKKVEQMHRFHP